MVESSSPIFTLQSFHSLFVKISIRLKSILSQYLSSDRIHGSSRRPAKPRKLSSLRLHLLKTCNGRLAHSEEKYPVSERHVDFAMRN